MPVLTDHRNWDPQLDGLTFPGRDIPSGADLSLRPQDEPVANTFDVFVVWNIGLFWTLAAVLEAIKGLGNIPYQRFINWPSALVAYYCGPRLQSARHWTIQQSDSPSDAPLSPPPPFPPPRTPRHRTTEPLGEYPRPPNPSPTLSSSSSDCLSGGDLEEFLENAFLEDEEASAFFQDGTNRTSLTDNFGAYSLWEEDTENEEKPLASSGLPMAPQVLSADTVCSKYPTAYPELYLRSSSEQPGSVRSGSPRRRVHGAGRGKGKSRPCRKGFWIVIRGKFPGIYTDRLTAFMCMADMNGVVRFRQSEFGALYLFLHAYMTGKVSCFGNNNDLARESAYDSVSEYEVLPDVD